MKMASDEELWVKLQSTLESVLGVYILEPTIEIGLNLVPEWDSLHQADLIEALESEFDVQITDDEFEILINVSKIYEFLKKSRRI